MADKPRPFFDLPTRRVTADTQRAALRAATDWRPGHVLLLSGAMAPDVAVQYLPGANARISAAEATDAAIRRIMAR